MCTHCTIVHRIYYSKRSMSKYNKAFYINNIVLVARIVTAKWVTL